MPPDLPNIFMPRRPRPEPASPTSSQPWIGIEQLKREIIDSDPEGFQNESGYGHVPGVPVLTTWTRRTEVANAGVHAPNTAGIWAGKYGARSIVMSGGYDDDVDEGDFITYTGTGGHGDDNRYGGNSSSGSAAQSDQSFDHRDNHALRLSRDLGRPVRVIRGSGLDSKYAPQTGYRYDGLYMVRKAYMAESRGGDYKVCRYELVREPDQKPIPTRWN